MPYQNMYGQWNPGNYAQSNNQMGSRYGQTNTYYQAPINGFIRVTGMDGAKAYPLPPNSDIPLFDENQDVFYAKTTDGAGFPTIRRFKFYPDEEAENPAIDISGFVTREEFEELKEMISNAEQPVPSKSESGQQRPQRSQRG